MGKMGMTEEQVNAFKQGLVNMVPLGDMGRSEEIAATALFLACDDSSYITGVDLAVDGGMARCKRRRRLAQDNGKQHAKHQRRDQQLAARPSRPASQPGFSSRKARIERQPSEASRRSSRKNTRAVSTAHTAIVRSSTAGRRWRRPSSIGMARPGKPATYQRAEVPPNQALEQPPAEARLPVEGFPTKKQAVAHPPNDRTDQQVN